MRQALRILATTVVSKIATDAARIVRSPEFTEKALLSFSFSFSFEPVGDRPDQFAASPKKDRAFYATRVRAANVRLE